MGHYYNPNIPIRSLDWLIDMGNFRSYPGSGNIIYNLMKKDINNLTNVATPTFSSAGATSYLSFNGSTQYSANNSITNGAPVQGPITINVIFNPSASTTTYNAIALYSGASNSVQIGYRSDISSGAIWKNGGTTLLTFPTVGIGTVCHIVYTCDGANNSRVYVNGQLWQSGTVATNTGNSTNYTIASFNSGAGEFLNGRIYYASIHSVVLNSDEVAQTYHCIKRRWGYSGVGTFVNGVNPTGDPSGTGGVGGPE